MDASSDSLSWLVVESITIVVAMVGGVFVFLGLWLEKTFSKDVYSSIDDFRSSKLKAHLGWKILMWGIFIEIVVAGVFAAKDGWEIRQIKINEAKTNPLNLPITFATATASIHVKGTNFVNANFDKPPNNRFVFLSFMRSGQKTSELNLIYKSSEKWGSSEDIWWHLEFGGDPAAPVSNLAGTNLVRSANEWDIVIFHASFLRTDAEVLGGEVRLVLNGTTRKTFPIPQQKADLRPIDGVPYPKLPRMEGTTSSNVNVRVVGTPGLEYFK